MSERQYDPGVYWEERLQSQFNLRGVGHIAHSETYNKWIYRRKVAVIRTIFSNTILSGKTVLDVGCGTGFFVEWYLRHGARLWGIDITEISINELSKRFEGEFMTQDITASGYTSANSFDIVNMWDVVYHIVDDDALRQAFTNVARSIKKGGLFLFTDWFGAQSDFRAAAHVKGRNLETHEKLLGERGFTLVTAKPLYRLLDRTLLGLTLDDHLGWLYYFLDMRQTRLATCNLSVGVWRREQ